MLDDSQEHFRIGMIGAGMISHYHLLAWAKVKGASVVAICDTDWSRAIAKAAQYGITANYRSVTEMLEHETLDAVDVACSPDAHADVVRLCARHRLPVLCQKPLAPTLRDAEQLVADVSGIIRLMVHENWRFRPYFRTIKSWIKRGSFGHINSCRLSYQSSGLVQQENGVRPALTRQPYMQFQQHLMIREILIHHLDVVRWLIGPLQVIGAVAAATIPDVRGETCAAVLLRTKAGVPVVVDGNIAVAGLPVRATDRLELAMEHATVRLADGQLKRVGQESEQLTFDLDAVYQTSFDDTIRHFTDCLISGAAFETDAQENLATLRLVEAAERAAGLC